MNYWEHIRGQSLGWHCERLEMAPNSFSQDLHAYTHVLHAYTYGRHTYGRAFLKKSELDMFVEDPSILRNNQYTRIFAN